MYATIEGMTAFLGADPDRIAEREDLAALLADCEIRLLAYIIPNSPSTVEQIAAFERAVYAQTVYEITNAQVADMPGGMTGFTVNGFSATFGGTLGDNASSVGICKRARAELMYAGLLYRGVSTC